MQVPVRDSRALLLELQRCEITEHHIYRKILAMTKEPGNREILDRISKNELEHYAIWKRHTGQDVSPDVLRIWYYYLIARVLGMTFAIKLMEGVEKHAMSVDEAFLTLVPEMPQLLEDEQLHEQQLIALIDEERLNYSGSVVLGLNDALVEFTGMLAGLTFALQNTRIIAVASLITGVAATMSMGSSEYLSKKADGGPASPVKSAFYTGLAYMMTIVILILPYLVLSSPYVALVLTLVIAFCVIFFFTFYMSVARDLPFRKRFIEMLAISFGIAAISFVIGLGIRVFLNVSI